jgi:hypothetical protein
MLENLDPSDRPVLASQRLGKSSERLIVDLNGSFEKL